MIYVHFNTREMLLLLQQLLSNKLTASSFKNVPLLYCKWLTSIRNNYCDYNCKDICGFFKVIIVIMNIESVAIMLQLSSYI